MTGGKENRMTLANASEGADRSRKVIGEASGSEAQTGTRRRPLGDRGFTQGRRGVRTERPQKSRLARRKEHLDQSSICTLYLLFLISLEPFTNNTQFLSGRRRNECRKGIGGPSASVQPSPGGTTDSSRLIYHRGT